jgi:hypothetical protein
LSFQAVIRLRFRLNLSINVSTAQAMDNPVCTLGGLLHEGKPVQSDAESSLIRTQECLAATKPGEIFVKNSHRKRLKKCQAETWLS